MSYVQWKVIRYAFTGNGWSATGTIISDFYDPILQVAIGEKKDSFSMKLNNPYDKWDNYFKPNDKVEIYRVTNSTTFSASDIKMVGIIRDIPTSTNGRSDEIRLDGYNFGEAIATGIVFINPLNKTPMEIIKEAVDNLALNNSNFNVTYTATSIPTTKKDGSAFPTYSEKFFYKSLGKVIETMLSDAYTADGAYYWWVDSNNVLQVRPNVDATTVTTYNSETDTSTISYKDGRDVSNVKNFIIIKGGSDPAGLPIQTTYRDFTSISKHGMKFYYIVSNKNYAANLNEQDMVSSWGTDQPTSTFPKTYPFQTTWAASYTKVVKGVSVVAGNKIDVTTDEQYTAVLREEAITKLKSDAKTLVDSQRWGKLQVDITTPAGSKSWNLADRVSCTIPRIGITNTLLRVVEIQMTTETDTYSLEEDIGTI